MADNFSTRAGLFGITTPTSVPTGPDAQGYQGSYRALQQGIDNSIPGNPGYADYAGLGGTASVAEVAKYSPVNMGGGLGANGAIQNPGYGMVPQVQRSQPQPSGAVQQSNNLPGNYGSGGIMTNGAGGINGGVAQQALYGNDQRTPAAGVGGGTASTGNVAQTSGNAQMGGVGMPGYSLTGGQQQTGGVDQNPYMQNQPVQQGNFPGNYGPGGIMTNGAGGINGGQSPYNSNSGVAVQNGRTGDDGSSNRSAGEVISRDYNMTGGDNQYNADNPQSRSTAGASRTGGPSQNLFGLGARGTGYGGQQQFQGMYQQAPNGINAPANLANGAPDFFNLANQQSGYNRQNALFQNQMNNPNYYGPGGSQTRTQNPDGSWSVNQNLNPTLQRGYEQQNELKTQLLGNAQQIANQGALNYNELGSRPQYNTDGVRDIPKSDALNLAITRNSVYDQQKQYLDPEFNQAQGDLENKLANQGITPGSEAFNREMDNFARTRQRAYGDARNSAIQAGGAEQSRLFGLGLQAHTTGTNDAMARFNTGMMNRQQGVSEINTMRNAPINELNALNGLTNTVQLPNYPGQTGTNIPGVDFMNAGNLQNNANLGISNANAARSQNNMNALYGLGSAFMQSSAGQNILNSMFGGDSNAYGNWLASNSSLLNQGMTPEDILGMM